MENDWLVSKFESDSFINNIIVHLYPIIYTS